MFVAGIAAVLAALAAAAAGAATHRRALVPIPVRVRRGRRVTR